jgi:GMP synthase (glutamine-hydrolysing)
MLIHCFQHVKFETPGTIKDWADERGHTISYTYFFEKSFTIPGVNDIDAMLVMGGYMNVDEEEKFPWLKIEKEFIKQAIQVGKKVIGICLGSQLIAAALGNKVYAGKEKEIGFFPVEFTEAALSNHLFNHFSSPYTVFHWHGDTYDLPADAALLASTNPCKHQAYLIGNNVLGLQFHFEMNEIVLEDMLLHDGHELEESGKYIASKDEIRTNYHHLLQNRKNMFVLLDKFFAA